MGTPFTERWMYGFHGPMPSAYLRTSRSPASVAKKPNVSVLPATVQSYGRSDGAV